LTRQAGTSVELNQTIRPEAFVLLREDLSITAPVEFEGQLLHTGHGILVLTGTIKAILTGTCARCLQPVPLTMETSLQETFKPMSDQTDGDADDLEVVYGYMGQDLDISQALIDNLIPMLPARLICREECAGFCPICGADRNTSPCDCLESGKGKLSPFDDLKQLL